MQSAITQKQPSAEPLRPQSLNHLRQTLSVNRENLDRSLLIIKKISGNSLPPEKENELKIDPDDIYCLDDLIDKLNTIAYTLNSILAEIINKLGD